VSFSKSRPIPSVCSAVLLLLAIAAPARAAAQQPAPGQDEALVTELARLLAISDARTFDAAVLREALQHTDPGVRRQAALAAGRIGDPAAVDLLVPALADTSMPVRAAAAFALGLLKEPRAVSPLLATVSGRSADQQDLPQLEAVTALAKIGGESGAQAIAVILEGASPAGDVAPAPARALLEAWRLGPRAPVATLIRFAEASDGTVRRMAVYSLTRLRTVQGVPALVNALQDGEAAVREAAARGITAALVDSARADRRVIAARLRALLGDPNPHVRINALRAVAGLRDSTLGGAVAALASDADVGVAVQAETTLGVIGGASAGPALRARLASPVFALRRQALIALAEMDSAAGAGAAVEVAADADWRWRSVAAEAFDAARSRGRLEALLADPEGRVVARALQGLERIVRDSADPALLARARDLLTHADPAVRSVAADVLARRHDPADIDRLTQAYTRASADPFDDARLSAVSALAAIANASGAGRLRVAERFVSTVPKADDYLVRRLAAERFPDAAQAWGPASPIATGKTDADYRDVARRYLLPALSGRAAPQVTIETDRGAVTLDLLAAEAPLTVAAFLALTDRRYFDGFRWHRVVPNFVVQDGDPRGDGWGGPGFVLRDEVNPVRYETGTMGMALSGPDTGGSQYFITLSAQPHLDGIYTVFARVVGDPRVLQQIAQGDRIRSIHR
jgi:cyclophilin family peptidyl-prolyl cis-trans isomerase/HEAT repeat protein